MQKRLPQPDALIVEQKKIVEYLLNPGHLDGAAKADYFRRFGFDFDAWEVLAEALRRHGQERDLVKRVETQFGTKFVVECAIETPNQRNPCIRSVWIAEANEPPRLVTAFPQRK